MYRSLMSYEPFRYLIEASPKITDHLKLTRCWVCKKTFIDSGGSDPAVIRNEHHVVPRAAGGGQGPVVSLCSSHHDLLHLIGEKSTGTAFDQIAPLIQGLTPGEQSKILYLAHVASFSFHETYNDPNRRLSVGYSATRAHMDKLDALKQALNVTSREDVLQRLVEDAYKRFFPL